MSYKETKEKMLGYIGSIEFVALFEGRNKDIETKVRRLFELADEAASDKPVDLKEARKLVKHVLFVLEKTVVEQSLSKVNSNFLFDLALFLFNFNTNLLKIKEIETTSQLIMRILQGNLTIGETIDILRAQNEIMRRWNKFEPPAFKLSRLYLESLKEK